MNSQEKKDLKTGAQLLAIYVATIWLILLAAAALFPA